MSAEIGELLEEPGEMRGLWRIPEFSSLLQGQREAYFSPKFLFLDICWRWKIALEGSKWIDLFLIKMSCDPPKEVNYSFSIRNASGKEEKRVTGSQTFSTYSGYGTSKFLRISDLQNWRTELAPSDVLTISYTLKSGDRSPSEGISQETQTEDGDLRDDDYPLEDISILRDHFKKLLLSGDGHDVLFKVGDTLFGAHKHVLKSRSPVFAAMFGSDMAESAGDSVTIEDCDADSFGQFLQFVYCGKADIASVGSALGLYYAGDKYDFPSLKKMCVEFLRGSFATTTVFDVVRLAVRHEEEDLLQQAVVYFANNLEEVWSTVEWQRFHLANPNEANEMNLKALQCLKSSLCKK